MSRRLTWTQIDATARLRQSAQPAAGEVTRAGRAAELISRSVRRDTCMSAENEEIIRRAYQRAEETRRSPASTTRCC